MLFIHLLDTTQPMLADGSFPQWAALPTVMFGGDTRVEGMTLAVLRAQAVACNNRVAASFAFAGNTKSFPSVSEALESALLVSEVGIRDSDGVCVLVRPAAAAAAAAADAAAARSTREMASVLARAGGGGWRACVRVRTLVFPFARAR
jgi:hypothetical protein